MRHKKLAILKVELASNQPMFHKSTQDSEVATEISFQISLLIAKMQTIYRWQFYKRLF